MVPPPLPPLPSIIYIRTTEKSDENICCGAVAPYDQTYWCSSWRFWPLQSLHTRGPHWWIFLSHVKAELSQPARKYPAVEGEKTEGSVVVRRPNDGRWSGWGVVSQLAGVAGRIYRECWLITIIGSGNNVVLVFLNQYLPLTSILNKFYTQNRKVFFISKYRPCPTKTVWFFIKFINLQNHNIFFHYE